MKTFLLTLALAAISIVHAHAQGTIQFANNAGTRFEVDGVRPRNTSDGGPAGRTYYFGVFVGATPDSISDVPAGPLGTNTTTGGLISAPNPNAYQLAGTEANATVYLQIRAWGSEFGSNWKAALGGGFYAETPVKLITLGPTPGPGTVIWGTDSARQFQGFNLVYVPEPGTTALAVLSGLAVMWLHRRRTTK